MQKYDLPAIVLANLRPNDRRSMIQGVGVEVPLGTERQYLAELRKVIRAIHAAIKADMMPLVRAELAIQRLTRDAVQLSWFENIERLSASLLRSIFGQGGRMRNVIWHQIERHTGSFIRTIQRGFGVNVSPFVRPEDVADYFENALVASRTAVEGLTTDLLARVRRVVIAGVIAGTPVDGIARDLRGEFETIDRKAVAVARNEVPNINTDLTEIRHKQAAIDEYAWRTRRDERVRALHHRLEGHIYKQGEATGAERGLPPGKPYGCRCWEAPIIRLPYRNRG